MRLKNFNSTLIDLILPEIDNKALAIARDIVLVLGFAFLTGISAKLKIEIGAVPITLQTFIVLLSGALLGKNRGALSQVTYLTMGLAGLPWFSRGGGIQYVLSPTFGYLVGFIFSAYLVGYLFEKGLGKNVKTAILAMLVGNIILYIPGLLWLAKFIGFSKVLTVGFYPFLIGDSLKVFLASLLLPIGWKILKNYER